MGASVSKTVPPGLEDLKALDPKEFEEYKDAFEKGGMSGLKSKVDEDINHWKNVTVNIAVTGNIGVGKSSFINSFRGLKANSKGAAEEGYDEMTKEPTKYLHPNNKSIALWDLPGVCTATFPRKTYLENFSFKDYDYFLIVTAPRVTENDLWLANEVQSLGKKFLLIRTKINIDVSNNKLYHPEMSKVQTVEKIRSTLTTRLTNLGFPETRFFLIDNHYPHDYDFPDLTKTMIEEAPKWKQEAMTLTMTTLTAIQRRIMIVALESAAVGAIPLPGLDLAVDYAIVMMKLPFM